MVFLSNAAILHLVVFIYKYNVYKLNLNQIIDKFCSILTIHWNAMLVLPWNRQYVHTKAVCTKRNKGGTAGSVHHHWHNCQIYYTLNK